MLANRHHYQPISIEDLDVYSIDHQLENYRFTPEIIQNLFEITQSIRFGSNGPRNVYWISGLIGAGKSYFIKYLFFIFNKSTSKNAFLNLKKAASVSGFSVEIKDIVVLEHQLNLMQFDVIMFNAVPQMEIEDSNILVVIMHQINRLRGYNQNDAALAILLEKQLDQKGKFKEFKFKIESELGFTWETDASVVTAFQLQDVLKIAKQLLPEIDVNALMAKLTSPDAFNLSLQFLSDEVKEILKEKDGNYRLIFIIDNIILGEIDSYRLLQLQELFQLGNLDSRISFIVSSQITSTEDLNTDKLRNYYSERIVYLPKYN